MQPMRPCDQASPPLSDPENGFIMLGTIHRDPDGPRDLADWLEHLRPDTITLEFSQYGLDFRRVNRDGLQDRLRRTLAELGVEKDDFPGDLPEGLFSFLEIPFEYTAVSRHCERTGIPFYLVDADLFSWLKLAKIDEMLEKENIKSLLSAGNDVLSGPSRERLLADLFFGRSVRTWRYTGEMLRRDRWMMERIRLLMEHHGPGRFVHVCGWQHLPDPHGVYASLKPVKVFVHDRTFRI